MRFHFRNTSGLCDKACLRHADGWVGGWVWRWVAGTQISYVGEQEACAGCKMDDEEGVSRQYSWDSSKQRLIEVPSKETNIPLQQDSASICTHTHSPHPTHHLSLPHCIHVLLLTIPLPAICLRQREDSAVFSSTQDAFHLSRRRLLLYLRRADKRGSAC